jgi:D-lactate dehydrogenase (cytochrome)
MGHSFVANSPLEQLRSVLGDRVTDAIAVREHHSHGESYHPPAAPDLVCFPSSTDEIVEIVRVSREHGLPVIPFGAGTSLEGHVHAIRGGISVDMRHMNRILRVSAEDLDASVEAGVSRLQLGKALRNTGLMFPIDPGADATIGGMAATRASGTTAVRYGTMRENVLGLTVVLADGRVVRTGTRARKSSSGYDLTRLFVGSEGTLGIITEITVRLHPLPEAISAAVCPFETMEGAVNAVMAVIQLGVSVARIELLDEAQIAAINKYARTSYAVAPTLFFEFHGPDDVHVAGEAGVVAGIVEEHGGRGFEWATKLEDRERLWKARHDALYAALALRAGSRVWTTDVCVPISRLAECITETQRDNAAASFPICLVGHAGDGNFHLLYVLDPASADELAEARSLNERLIARALTMGGTSTGEHGIGTGKMPFLEAEHGAGVSVMRDLKRALDPENRMNPGKIVEI